MRTFLSHVSHFLLLLTLVSSCSKEPKKENHIDGMAPQSMPVQIRLHFQPLLETRTFEPKEQILHDLNLFLFHEDGSLEKHLFLNRQDLKPSDNAVSCHLNLLEGVHYHIRAAANLGYCLPDMTHLEELEGFRYHLAYPDDFSCGVPMTGSFDGAVDMNSAPARIDLNMERLLAKISISMDRRNLDEGIKLTVKGIWLRQIPKSVSLFQPSAARNNLDIFKKGYGVEYLQADALNREKVPGLSKEASLYLFENRLGNLLPEAKRMEDKILPNSIAEAELASYIEMEIEYQSELFSTAPEKYLLYRFYLGEGPQNFDIGRNCHYHYVIRPIGNGLKEISWRVDKTQLSPLKGSPFNIHPSQYIEGKAGEELYVWAELKNPTASFDIGMEELEYERKRGMFTYQVSPNGKGVRLQLKQQGSAILYMSSGSYSDMVFIVINP